MSHVARTAGEATVAGLYRGPSVRPRAPGTFRRTLRVNSEIGSRVTTARGSQPTVDLGSQGQSSTAMYRLDRATKQSYQVESSEQRALRTDRARAERPKSIGPHNFRFQTEDLLGHR